MSTRIEAYQLEYEQFPSESSGTTNRFARIDATVDARVSAGYYGYDDNTGRMALYIHEESGLVTADRTDFLRWLDGLAVKQYREED